jgi:hypothetical protein
VDDPLCGIVRGLGVELGRAEGSAFEHQRRASIGAAKEGACPVEHLQRLAVATVDLEHLGPCQQGHRRLVEAARRCFRLPNSELFGVRAVTLTLFRTSTATPSCPSSASLAVACAGRVGGFICQSPRTR